MNGSDTTIPPNICTLVGPTKHHRSFDHCGYHLGLRGWLVFSVGSHLYNDVELRTTQAHRRVYFRTHRQKIDLSSLVYVCDLVGPKWTVHRRRIGDDTGAEIEYALAKDIEVKYQSDGVFPTPPSSWKDVEGCAGQAEPGVNC